MSQAMSGFMYRPAAWLAAASIAACLGVVSPQAMSQSAVYKCSSPSGKVEFSDAPCAAGRKSEEVSVEPNTIDTSGERAAVARAASQAQRDRQAARSRPGPRVPVTAPQPARPSMDSASCKQAESDYQSAASTAGTSNGELQARASAAYAACGTSPPRPRVIRNVR